MASSSSSHQQNEEPHNDQEHHAFSGIEPPGIRRKVDESRRLYDVFINHRGPDVKDTLATQLYISLQELGIRVFLDSKEKELGDSFPSTIETAIRSAAVHIAIFSKKYAESPWCLAELVLMLQSKAKIVPVFYDVQPGELRHIEKGVYADAFTNYEKKSRYLQKLKEWKEALQSVSFLTGEEFNGDCKNIVSAVQKEFERFKPKLPVAKYPVGLHKLVQDFEKKCLDELVDDFESQCRMREEGKDKPKIVGIFGMGGIGKTTLYKELFNRKRSQYSRRCFLFDVREAYGLEGFQSILSSNWTCFGSVEERSINATIRYFIGNSNGRSHTSTSLLWLAIHFDGFYNFENRTQMKNHFSNYKNRTQMISIPSWIPLQNLQYLAISFGDLIRLWQSDVKQPSSLKELYIKDTTLEEFPGLIRMSNRLEKVVLNGTEIPIEWLSFLESLKSANLSRDNDGYAAFGSSFSRVKIGYATFESSSSHVVLKGLQFRGLVALNNKGQSPTVESPMSSLRKVEFGRQHSVTKVLISGYHYPNLESLHLTDMDNLTDVDLISVTTLVSLELTACYNLKSISGISHLTNLKVLKIKECSKIEELPGLSHLTNLKVLKIKECSKFEELPGLSHLSCLKKVSIVACTKLKSVSGISHLTNLKVLKIKGCSKFEVHPEKLPPGLSHLTNLKVFKSLCRPEIEELPVLSHLELDECANLKVVYISSLPKLVKISIHHCSELETVKIERCEKLQNIAGIERCEKLQNMEILLCNGVAIRNCIHSLQRVPCEHLMVIESAAEGAESTLGAHLFPQWIAPEEVIQLGAHVFPQWIQLGLHEDNLVETMADVGSLGAIIYCAGVAIYNSSGVVVVGSRSLSSL
ncbi:hypothetical protein KI387_032720, partial [Taxus chinensis]